MAPPHGTPVYQTAACGLYMVLKQATSVAGAPSAPIAYREGGPKMRGAPPPPPSRYASDWELSRVGNVRGWKCTGGRRPAGNCPTICTGYPVCLLVLYY